MNSKGGCMNWVSSSIDAETVFDCPHCGGSLIHGLAFCRHVVFFFIDTPDDAARYYYASDAFSSYLYLEIVNSQELSDIWLENPDTNLVGLAKAGRLGYQEIPGIEPTKEFLQGYCGLDSDMTVYEFTAKQLTYGGHVMIGLARF
jgi:hypothetical protein